MNPFRRVARSQASRRLPDEQLRVAWQAVSLLLDYPTPEWAESHATIRRAVAGLPEPVRMPLSSFLDHVASRPLEEVQRDYVETFDHTRKCALYLTYFAYGDTRRRGAALVQFKQAYRDAGAEWDESCGELPDHLCAVLQFGATIDPDGCWRLLNDHRAGVEMLRIALAGWRNADGSTGSPWHGAVPSVRSAR